MKKITLLLFAIFSVVHVKGQVGSYSFSQSNGTYTALSSPTILATQTVASGTAAGALDDVIYAAPLPFAFTFNGVSYPAATNINVSSNGFITFGATAPAGNNYTPVSNTATYDAALAGFGVDANGGYALVGSNTNGSPDLTIAAGTTSEFAVGAPVAGTGIPAGATVVSVTATTITLSANCTSTGTGRTFHVGTGQISYQVLGSAPNQQLVVQFKRMRPYNTTYRTIDYQIVLNETTNVIDYVYGFSIGSNLGASTPQVGLRGATNTAFNNRTSTTSWATTTAGGANTSTITFSDLVLPASGLTYSWTPPLPCAGTPTPGTVAPASLSLCTGSLPGNLVASGYSAGVAGLAFQWQESPDGLAWGDAVGGSGATTTTYTPPAYSGTPIQYRLRVTCTNSGLFDYSTAAVISSPSNPTTQVTNATSAPWSTSSAVSWTNGNGSRRVVVLSDVAGIVDPVNGNAAALVAAAAYAGTGQQIVYDGTGTTVTVTGLLPATNYYVKVYEYLRCGAGPYDYYYNVTSGTNVITVTTLSAPANDLCAGAIPLTIGADFAAQQVSGTLLGATTTAGITPSCQASFGLDVWYSVTVPSTGNVIIQTLVNPSNSMTDSIITVYTGACGALTQVACDDDGGPTGPNDTMSIVTLTGRTPGEVLYVAVWKWQPAIPAATATQFLLSAYDCPSQTPAPTGAANQTFCSYNNPTVANLVATGTGIKWYDAATAGNLLVSTDALVSGNVYYASQTTTCEGLARLAVTVTINTPIEPTGSAAQTFCFTSNPTIADLVVTGTGLVWYDAATLGNVLPTSTVLTATTYYVASNDGTCESTRLAIAVTEDCPVVGCLNAPNGQWPGGAYTPANCNGLVENSITTNAYAGEYSVVNVTLGQTYVFKSTINATGVHDFVTISADGGTTAAAAGTSPLTWVSTVTGAIRFYSHVDNACGVSTAFRTRFVTCGVPSLALPDYANLQFPATISIAHGQSEVVYGQVYEGGLTDVAPNIVGQAPGIQAWVGISPIGSNTNPNTWTNWLPATWNSGHVSNNDEYQATIVASTLAPGTYYYATRFNLDNGAYVYGGTNDGFWDGTTHLSGVLTITGPSNDNFANPIAVTCGNVYTGNTTYATLDENNAPDGFGADLDAPNLWYSFTGSGAAQTVTLNLCGSAYDTSVLVYTGTSGNLTLVSGNDDDNTCVSNTANSSLSFASDGTTTYYITVEGWNVGNVGAFTMNVTCAAVTPPAVTNQDCGTALPVLVDGSDNNSDNSFGTVSSTQPTCDLFGSIQDVWFSFVAPASGSVTALLTPGTMTSLNYNVYSGTCGALTAVGNCNSNLTVANTQQYTTLTPGQTYYVQVWSNAAEQGTFVLRLTDDGLGNGSFDNASFSYYPNPVKNTLNLSYSQDISTIEVYNLLGQRISAISVNANQAQIDMSNLPSAAYVIKVTANQQVKTIRVIKE